MGHEGRAKELKEKVKQAKGLQAKAELLAAGLVASLRTATDIADLNKMLDEWEAGGKAEAFADLFDDDKPGVGHGRK